MSALVDRSTGRSVGGDVRPPGLRTTVIARTVGYAVHPREETTVADKSPRKSSGKTTASKTLKEKRVEKKDKTAAKRKAE